MKLNFKFLVYLESFNLVSIAPQSLVNYQQWLTQDNVLFPEGPDTVVVLYQLGLMQMHNVNKDGY